MNQLTTTNATSNSAAEVAKLQNSGEFSRIQRRRLTAMPLDNLSLIGCSLLLLTWLVAPAMVRAEPNTKDETSVLVEPKELPPWRKEDDKSTGPSLQPHASPREALIDIGPSELDSFLDNESLDPSDSTLVRILFRLPKVGLDHVERYANQTSGITPQQLLDDPRAYGAEMFHLSGRLKSLERIEMYEEVSKFVEFEEYYRVTMLLNNSSISAVIHSRAVPDAWLEKKELDEPASCFGLFLKDGNLEGDESNASLLFASARVAWRPDREDPDNNIGKSHLLLSKLGMDVGLFDEVRSRNGKPFSSPDAECFYQLLAAVERTNPEQLNSQSTGNFELAPLLQDPKTHHGELVEVKGNVRRITKIAVDNPYIKERLNIDHYYEIDIFVPIDQHIKLGKSKDGESVPEFRHDYPITVCARHLPAELKESDQINETVRITAFFFKLWSYRSQYVRQFEGEKSQISPMLVGVQPELIPYKHTANPFIGAAAMLIVVLAIGGIWAGLWIYGRGDKKFDRETLKRQYELEKGKSLNKLDLEVQEEPDFSGLE